MFVLNRGIPDTNKGTSFIDFGPKKETFGASPPNFEVKVKFEETALALIKKGFEPVNDEAKALAGVKVQPKEEVTVELEDTEDVEDSPKKVLPKPKK